MKGKVKVTKKMVDICSSVIGPSSVQRVIGGPPLTLLSSIVGYQHGGASQSRDHHGSIMVCVCVCVCVCLCKVKNVCEQRYR